MLGTHCVGETESLQIDGENQSDASRILICVRKLEGLQKHNEMVKANIKKRSQELELKEKELQSLSLDLEKRCKIFRKEKAESGNLKKMVVECTEELRSKRNQLTVKMDSLTRCQRELEIKEKQLGRPSPFRNTLPMC